MKKTMKNNIHKKRNHTANHNYKKTIKQCGGQRFPNYVMNSVDYQSPYELSRNFDNNSQYMD